MARRKPLDQLSPAYRRRIESAGRRGLSRSQARGHGPQGSEYRARVYGRAERMIRTDPYRRPGEHVNNVNAYLRIYTVAGLIPMLKLNRAAQDAFHVWRTSHDPAALDALDRAREDLRKGHNRYRRKRVADPSLPYAPRPARIERPEGRGYRPAPPSGYPHQGLIPPEFFSDRESDGGGGGGGGAASEPPLYSSGEPIGDDLWEVDLDAAYEGHDDYDTLLLFYH